MTGTMTNNVTGADEIQLATFYVGDLLLGLDIGLVQEINRSIATTVVPHAHEFVRGVVNLRGDVATVVDLRRVLGFPSQDDVESTRSLIVRFEDESIGLRVDRVSDILTAPVSDITAAPANVAGTDGRFFTGVLPREGSIVVILDLSETLSFTQKS